ncbi:uncharacterized protein CCOS01_12530, partial [Colletotrichum costaricense]
FPSSPLPVSAKQRPSCSSAQLSSGEGPGGRGCSCKGEVHQPTNPRTPNPTPARPNSFVIALGFHFTAAAASLTSC